MLILNRREGESIKIGDDIEIEIVSVSGNSVKIGISAPQEVSILRKELYDSIISENINASMVDLGIDLGVDLRVNLEKLSELKFSLQPFEENINNKK
jgi:carbon storage regulator